MPTTLHPGVFSAIHSQVPVPFPAIHERMKAAASIARLPLRSGRWRGSSGSVLGDGTGSSIDFQDQRAYAPGDDPRHINWLATARTGHTTMKLYRQEVTPKVDILFDISSSMFLTEAKETRSWELLYFCLESALRLGATPRIHLLGEDSRETPIETALGHHWEIPAVQPGHLSDVLPRTPLRAGSMRILISDLLSPAPPEKVLPFLAQGTQRVILLAHTFPEEYNPYWSGNIDFEDCESAKRDRRRVEPDLLQRYHRAYATHFRLWHEQAQRYQGALARVPADMEFLPSLRREAATAGCVDLG